ncbi:MAG: TetR/AcrR family transcriptional regulator [Thermodesulfobacteriota bacterium]
MGPLGFGEGNMKLEGLPRRERTSLLQRKEILDAALDLFAEKGYHNVSMHEIAKRAEFGIGTLYKFFANKEELYKALNLETAEKWHHALLQTLDEEGNPLRAIEKYILLRQKLFWDNLPLMRLFFAETRGASFNTKAGLDKDLLKLYDEHMERLASVFEQGIEKNVFRALDPFQMALALDGAINTFLFQLLSDSSRSYDAIEASTATDIFFHGALSRRQKECESGRQHPTPRQSRQWKSAQDARRRRRRSGWKPPH